MKKIKRSGYKYQIEQEIAKQDWEIVEISSNSDWWDDENWKIQFKYNPGISFYLCFIVDPQFEGDRKKGQGIYQVKASSDFPKNWNDDETMIASISMAKRKFKIKLEEFINDLEEFKMRKTTTNRGDHRKP